MPRRGENIYKRKDGRWEARFVKDITPDGKKIYGSVYAKTYKEVKDKQHKLINTPKPEKHYNTDITVSEIINQWLMCIKNRVKPITCQKYTGICKNHIIPAFGSIPINAVSNYTIETFINQKLENDNLSHKTINDILVVINLIFKYAKEEYNIITPTVRYLKEEKKEIRLLSIQEQNQLVSYLVTNIDIYKLGVLISLYTGIRLGELCALEWNDITEEFIQINKTMTRIKTDNKTEIIIGSPKSRNSNRIIPTAEILIPYLKKFRKEGYLLSTNKSLYTDPRLMQMKFEKMVKECGLNKANFHSLRHTFATRCIEAGVDVKTLSEILGHSDVKTTLNRYVHSSFELKQKSIKQLELSLIS